MSGDPIQVLLKKIDMVKCHVRTFSRSFPKILKDTSLYAQSHLIVVHECLPYLNKLLTYIEDSLPLIDKMTGLATQGTTDLSKATQHLDVIDQSSERAVQEILDVIEEVRQGLAEASEADDCGPQAKAKIESANGALFSMMEALQFQDITSQRVRATHVLLEELDRGLTSLTNDLGKPEPVEAIKVVAGSYDPDSVYDREIAHKKQQEVDSLIEGFAASPKAKVTGVKRKSRTRANGPVKAD
jgi:hypothetical protein